MERVYRVVATRIRSNGELFVMVFKDQSETRRIGGFVEVVRRPRV